MAEPGSGDLPAPSQTEIKYSQLPPPQIVSSEELDKTLFSAPRQFSPTTERLFPQIVGRNFTEIEALDLSKLPSGSVIQVAGGAHLGADYTLELIDSPDGLREVYIWRGGHCLKGSSEGIISYNTEDKNILLRRKALAVGDAMVFPYFSVKEGQLLPPKDSWIDTCADIRFSTETPPVVPPEAPEPTKKSLPQLEEFSFEGFRQLAIELKKQYGKEWKRIFLFVTRDFLSGNLGFLDIPTVIQINRVGVKMEIEYRSPKIFTRNKLSVSSYGEKGAITIKVVNGRIGLYEHLKQYLDPETPISEQDLDFVYHYLSHRADLTHYPASFKNNHSERVVNDLKEGWQDQKESFRETTFKKGVTDSRLAAIEEITDSYLRENNFLAIGKASTS